MLDHFQWWPFLLAITALTLTPGLDTLLVIRNAARGGWRDGLLTSTGICSGLFVHALISAAGLSVILLGSAQLFLLLKYAGAGYLVWLGWQSLRTAWRARALALPEIAPQRVPMQQSLREGFLSNVLNPKTIIFYMAFLPQFIDPQQSAMGQSMVMAAIHFLIASLWQGALVLLVGRARLWLARPRVGQVMNGLTGLLLVGFGVRLALER
ncbi:LysE family translocator [Aestuariirhabdus litorea]|uniref:LysE family translocator n=1 Tax=Aestuariirhabdus litorea TaxID=2528527 RepID=A0A3P3VI76_9GAMM|nr:LysE family translocator [Aestuariirhabdus litorea]RRJ82435.1 LysE family translocator [Aestuariirhabdus litorea]RWW92598.1 LysE family translocator [Endozoicomonadaceae bacterium GTF-13]